MGRRKERLVKLEEKVNIPVRKFVLDLSQEKEREILKAELERLKPQVKFLVNAAGFGKIGNVCDLSEKTVRNGAGKLYCSDSCYHHGPSFYVSEQPHPAVCFQCSLSAPAGLCSICSFKGYVLSYSRALNRELKGRKIFVTAICPGPVRTEFFDIAQTTGEIPLYKKLVMAAPGRLWQKQSGTALQEENFCLWAFMNAFWILAKVFPHSLILDMMEKIEYLPGKDRW